MMDSVKDEPLWLQSICIMSCKGLKMHSLTYAYVCILQLRAYTGQPPPPLDPMLASSQNSRVKGGEIE